MTEKKDNPKSQTKAGMLGKKGSEKTDQRDENKPIESSGKTPKIKKETAEGNHDDKPIH